MQIMSLPRGMVIGGNCVITIYRSNKILLQSLKTSNWVNKEVEKENKPIWSTVL